MKGFAHLGSGVLESLLLTGGSMTRRLPRASSSTMLQGRWVVGAVGLAAGKLGCDKCLAGGMRAWPSPHTAQVDILCIQGSCNPIRKRSLPGHIRLVSPQLLEGPVLFFPRFGGLGCGRVPGRSVGRSFGRSVDGGGGPGVPFRLSRLFACFCGLWRLFWLRLSSQLASLPG